MPAPIMLPHNTILVSVSKVPRENGQHKILRIQWAVINSEMVLIRGFSFFIQDEQQDTVDDQNCGTNKQEVSQYGKPIEYVMKKFIYDYGQCGIIAGPDIESDLAILGAEAKRLEIIPGSKIEEKVQINSENKCPDLNTLIKSYIQQKSGIFV